MSLEYMFLLPALSGEEDNSAQQQQQPSAGTQGHKRIFDFNFGTYPRTFRKKKKIVEPAAESSFGTEATSVVPSSTTQPSFESSSSPQGDRGPGPVRSRWADKFMSETSYNDSEGSRYRRYGSEQESFDKESSLERRMKDDLDESGSDTHNLGILGGVSDTKQFAEFDEENRAIHEISHLRSGEFKRRPMVHQDSDLRSEDSKEAIGWTEREIQKNKLLRKAEMEAEASYLKYHGEDSVAAQETQSTASSGGRKVVMEEIDDDEFFLRKRGISEDNIEIRHYISSAIRGEYETSSRPINALKHVGRSSQDPIDFGGFDLPPAKPRRLHKAFRPHEESQEFDIQRSEFGDDFSVSQNGSDFFLPPKKPMRKDRSRSKYSMDSENPALTDDFSNREQYSDNEEEYLRRRDDGSSDLGHMNNLSFTHKDLNNAQSEGIKYPLPPRRQKRHNKRGSSLEKDSLMNGFDEKSVNSVNYLQKPTDVIVYRTEHEYHIPMATPENYTDDASTSTKKSLTTLQYDADFDRFSHDSELRAMETNNDDNIDIKDRPEQDQEKYIIDMMENDGYAIVRKEHMPKPTPPARRKRFARLPGERFATLPNMRKIRGTPPPERPPPPKSYTPSSNEKPALDDMLPVAPLRKSAQSLDEPHIYDDDDYEEPAEAFDRPESPRNLQSGEIINKMKYRPLPPPPKPPREKRLRGESRTFNINDEDSHFEYADSEDTAQSERTNDFEVEVSTQTDPLPDDFEVGEFEITENMRIIEPRIARVSKTLNDLLKDEEETQAATEEKRLSNEDEQLARGLQKFREANQRSLSERSRASSQADRSKSLSRPQTPSAVVIESRRSTPSPYQREETMLEASLTVRPIDDLDLEEEALRREGLLSDSSQHSKSDAESHYKEYASDSSKLRAEERSNPTSSTELLNNVASDYDETQLLSDSEQWGRTKLENETTSFNIEEEEEATAEDDAEEEEEAVRYSSKYDDMQNVDIKINEKTDEEDDLFSRQYTEEEVEDEPIIVQHDIILQKESQEHQVPTASESPQPLHEEQPLPPPRRKSTTVIEPPSTTAPVVLPESTEVREVASVQSLVASTQVHNPMPTTLTDLEVERLHVHALQAGQIMVSHLSSGQIGSEQFECNSGNLIVNNIQLPPGFVEDIVERVRNTERQHHHLLTVETQTSLGASSEDLPIEESETVAPTTPPKKPARLKQRDESETVHAENGHIAAQEQIQSQPHKNPDEETQTDPIDPTLNVLPAMFPTAEYLQSLAPFALYNLQRGAIDDSYSHSLERTNSLSRKRRPPRRHSSSSPGKEEEGETSEDVISKAHTTSATVTPHRRRTRSTTQPPETPSLQQATRQFLSACSLSLVNIINQLTDYVRAGTAQTQNNEQRPRHIPTLVALFIVITLVLLFFLLSGKSVHTHHWDFFNLPNNQGRQ